MAKELVIEIASDVICPWCYIGKRRLEKALSLLDGEVQPEIRWLPFQLNPDMPAGGVPRAEYRRAKFGSVERGRSLDRIERTPNRSAAHQLIDLAQSQGRGQQVVDALFRAYFEEARDIGDRDVLASIAMGSGVSGWPGQADPKAVAELEDNMRGLGISAVPTFVFERKFGISGAHPPEALASAIRQAIEQQEAPAK
jgi:predicted DsbA family dithiol-disulfide isomerase